MKTDSYPQPLGDLGEATLRIDETVPPSALPCRKLPLAIQEETKREIEKLVTRGVLIPVTEPTKWVSQMTVVKKPTGRLRICLDPQPLNDALMREHYRLPTVDDVLPMLNNAKLFSKTDVRDAFWHVRLDEESSKLTTMITPFGRYRWARLPFGLKTSSEIFARKLNEALCGLEGTFTIADDIIVAACGKTHSETVSDNEQKLRNLYKRCQERNIILNSDKEEIASTEITVHGHRFTSEGVKVDTKKVSAICEMPAPTDVHGVKRLCGMVQYMAKFMPNLASDLESIRALTRTDVDWNWSNECEDAFNKIKAKLSDTPVLAYFDPDKELELQVDASKDGLGAAILQSGKPIEYASRALTPSERNWAQIEKETLAVVFGLERFDQYTYGREVKVINDHKPLAAILRKPLSQAPKRLQSLMMRMHRYDIKFKYQEGPSLVIADTLSRAFVDTDDRPHIMCIDALQHIPGTRLEEVREATSVDPTMMKLLHTIVNGWPKKKEQAQPELKPYYDMRDVLSHQDGIIVKGEAILVPKALRNDMKKRLHTAHLGYDSMMRRARDNVYWPGISGDIKQMADSCEACQEAKPHNPKEPLIQHSDGEAPWIKIGTDLFELEGRNYLLTVDYYTNFIEVDYLPTTTSEKVISCLKRQFARFGCPRQIISDGATQYTSQSFQNFVKEWGIIHKTSSPMHPQGNGKAEAAVKITKNMMKKAHKDNTDQYMALLELRNTPRQDVGKSPALMMFGRDTRSATIPSVRKPHTDKLAEEARRARKRAVKTHYDQKSSNLSILTPGQCVYFQHRHNEQWRKGIITETLGERAYNIRHKRRCVSEK